MEAKVAQWKKEEVKEIKRLLDEYSVFGIINVENLPSLQLQRLKHNLKDKIYVKMSKKRLINRALDEMKKENFDKVKEEIKGIPALIFTKENPFRLAKLLRQNKSNAPAKPGQIAPIDIYVKAGPTPFPPGPIIGELGQLGIKTEVKEGKVNIRDDKLLVKENEVINAKQADLLSKLKIEPMKIGINLILTYENGEILTKAVLEIDDELYVNSIKIAHQEGLNLALAIGYVSKDTISYLIKKASREISALENLEKIKNIEVINKDVEKKEEKKEEIKREEKQEPRTEEIKEAKKEPKKIEDKSSYLKRERVINTKPNAQDLIEEADKTPKTKKEIKEIEDKKMKEVEEITKKILWGEN
nr:50S ribosomal protein L10 [Candidatus Woesearchaeota archaeon]